MPGAGRPAALGPAGVLLVAALFLAGCDRIGASEVEALAPSPTVTDTATPSRTAAVPRQNSPTATPRATPTPVETGDDGLTESQREALLEQRRASNDFLELAEADRATTATWARLGYGAFAPHAAGERQFEWANKEELWDSVAPAFRDECLLRGRPAIRPMWDAAALIAAGIEPRWNNDSTGGRGQFVEFVCVYVDEESDESAERWAAVLIATDEDRNGRVLVAMPAFTIHESEFETYDEALAWAKKQLWDWVVSQPIMEEKISE